MSHRKPSDMPATPITLRDIREIADLRRVVELQGRVGGWNEHAAPLRLLIASLEVGAFLVGAFDRETIAGFVYAFPGLLEGQRILHSHMLAMDPAYRHLDLGYRLKVAQRDRAMARGVSDITWTFDPLQSPNAHLNVTKLGVLAESYRVDYYGDVDSSAGANIGTDRLWVRWRLNSERVRRRLEGRRPGAAAMEGLGEATPLVRHDEKGRPVSSKGPGRTGPRAVSIEIPEDVKCLLQEDPAGATAWREATRAAFLACFDAGYALEDFVRSGESDRGVGRYLLVRSGADPGVNGGESA